MKRRGVLTISRAEQWANQINAQLGKTIASILDVGRTLIEAKTALEHGEWLRIFNDELVPFGEDTAQRLMRIVRHPVLSNTAHGRYLPSSWRTLYELTKVEPPARLRQAIRDGVITPDMPRKAVFDLVVREPRRTFNLAPLPAGRYRLIYADPPWRYEHVETESRAIENQYPTMTLEAICALEIPAADDAVLFLWATSPKLAEAIRVLEAWGFTYRTCAVWDKGVIGMGYYFRQQHELLLVGARGELPVPEPSNRPSSVLRAPRREHSEKPDAAAALIEGMYPTFTDAERIELFARRLRPGWTTWINQAAIA